MKRQLTNWVCLCLLLMRCSSSSSELGSKPDNLIPEDKMAAILTDVHLSEARIAKMGMTSGDTSALLFKRLQANTLKKFSVDTATYTKNFIYYSARPEKLARIYEQVVEKLKVIEKKKIEKAGKANPMKPQ